MTKSAMFVDEEKRAAMVAWCERFREKLAVPTEARELATSFGATRVLVTGPADAPPLVVLHGMMASAAHVLPELGSLTKTRRVYAVDVLGQSPCSEDRRLDLHDGSYARWALEVLDALALPKAALFGISWGGFVAYRTAIAAPDRVAQLVLLVPAGLVKNGVWAGLRDAGWAFLTYKMFPTDARRERFMGTLFTTLDPDWVAFVDDGFRAFKADIRIPPRATDAELASIQCPTLVFGAERDASFPGAKLLARVKECLPSAEVELIEGARHCPAFTDEFRGWLASRVDRFLEEHRTG
ncbi:MAG: alpha/beta hydrolase [Polyangiaceae bacterium]